MACFDAPEDPPAARPPWWREFFDAPACLWLGRFPDAATSRWEAGAVADLLGLGPGQVVADIPCGPGRHLPTWAARGCRVVGLDASAPMLALARLALAEAGCDAALVAGLMQELPFADGVFDAVVSLFNSFGYLEADEGNARVVAEAARCLKPGGRFLLDTRNPTTEILTAPYRQPDTLPDGRAVVCSSRYDRAARRMATAWRDAASGQELFAASIRLYGPDELKAMFAAAGLQVLGLYGDVSGTPFEGDHGQLIVVGRKP
jgi:SAM-dependent methyltransferase